MARAACDARVSSARARRCWFRRASARALPRRVRGEWRVLALGAPALLPGVLLHAELELVDVRAVAIVDIVTVREFRVSELRRYLEPARVVRAQFGSDQTQVEIIKEIAVQRERGVGAVPFAPLVRVDDEVIHIEAVSHRPEMAEREADKLGARVDRPEHILFVLRDLFESVLPRRRHGGLVPNAVRAPHAQISHPAVVRVEIRFDRKTQRRRLSADRPTECHVASLEIQRPTGSRTANSAPPPSTFEARIEPPCACAMA